MRKPEFYRYFLGFQPDNVTRARIVDIAEALGIDPASIIPDMLHLTLFVIEETPHRDNNLAGRIDGILRQILLESCRIKLGRAQSGPHMATLRSIGRQSELLQFYHRLVELLRPLGVEPRYRKSGLKAHVTLSYATGNANVDIMPFEWSPHKLLLIESWYGCSHHEVLARWPISAAAQGEFGFYAGVATSAIT